MQSKRCSKCCETKELSEFHRDSHHKDRLRYDCKVCVLKMKAKYDATHQLEIKNYYIENKEQILKQTKKYKEKHKKERHEYYLKNKDKIREQNRISRKKRLHSNIQTKLASVIRTTIWLAVKKNRKYGKSIELLGCSIEFLKKHLESRFIDGMNWDNYGRGWNGKKEWHIDHIKPIDSFNLCKENEQRVCFNYTNLQPLWAKENLIKYNKIGE